MYSPEYLKLLIPKILMWVGICMAIGGMFVGIIFLIVK